MAQPTVARSATTREETNSQTSAAGRYKHPGSGEIIDTLWDPLTGDAQSEAAIRVGFVRVGDTPEGAVKTIVGENVANRTAEAVSQDVAIADGDTAALKARVSELQKENKALLDDNTALRQTTQKADDVPGGEETKQAAVENELRRSESGNSDPLNSGVTGQDASTAPVPPVGSEEEDEGDDTDEDQEPALDTLNREQLNAKAAELGVENPQELANKGEVVAAIEQKQAESQEGNE